MKTQKTLLLTVLLIAMLNCTSDEYGDSFLDPENYRLTKRLNYRSSSDSKPYNFLALEYYKNGNLKRKSLYYYPNILSLYHVYNYDSNNLLKEEITYAGEPENLSLNGYTKYEYEDGNKVKEEDYLANGTLFYTKYYEYENNNLVNTYSVNDKFGIHNQYKYTYNNLNLLILEESYASNQELNSYTKYSYDDNLRLIKEEFNHNGTITTTIEYKYTGDDTQPSEEIHYGDNGNLNSRRQLIYDNFKNLTEIKIITPQGTEASLFKKKFNGKLLVEEITYALNFGDGSAEWTVSRFEYEYKRK